MGTTFKKGDRVTIKGGIEGKVVEVLKDHWPDKTAVIVDTDEGQKACEPKQLSRAGSAPSKAKTEPAKTPAPTEKEQ